MTLYPVLFELIKLFSQKQPEMLAQNRSEGVLLIDDYMYLIINPDVPTDLDEVDEEDLQPSAEDLEIFAELEREQEERETRIARGEPAVDPMVRILSK